MSNSFKIFFGWLFLFSLLSILFINYSEATEKNKTFTFEDALESQSSIADTQRFILTKDLNQLFGKLGINKKTRSANPCIDIEEYTLKWCSLSELKISSKELALSLTARKFLIDALKTKLPCETLALHIGRTCEQENLMQIIQHFSGQK